MRFRLWFILSLLLLLHSVSFAGAQGERKTASSDLQTMASWSKLKAYTPKPGTTERKALVDALRLVVRKDLKKPVIFLVKHIKVQGEWAFLEGKPLMPNGKPMNYTGTRYQQLVLNGVFSGEVTALLHQQNTKWKIVAYNIGATDVVWEPWPNQYRAPRAIFPEKE